MTDELKAKQEMNVVRAIIERHARNAKGISYTDIARLAQAEGVPHERVKPYIHALMDNGELYSPRPWHYNLAAPGVRVER